MPDLDTAKPEEPSPSAQRFETQFPTFAQLGRTGASRYSPSLRGDRFGRVFTYSPDSISIQQYDKMRMDAQIRAGLQLLKLPIMQADWSMQSEDSDISAFCTEVMKPIWSEFIRHTLLAMEFGFSVFEKIWTVTYDLKVSQNQGKLKSSKERTYPHAITLERLMSLDPQILYLLAYRWSGEFAGVRQYAPNTSLIPSSKCFLYSNDHEFSEWHGVSRLKPCYPYWVFKSLMYEFVNIHYETWSMPMKKGRYPIGKAEIGRNGDDEPIYKQNSQIMIELLDEMRNNFSIALPSNPYDADVGGGNRWDVELMLPQTSGSDHLEFIDHLNLMMLKGLLVPQLALEVGPSGSYGMAEQQIDFFMLNTKSTMDQISTSVNKMLLPQLVKFNFGAKAPIPRHVFTPVHGDIKEGLQQLFFQTLGSGQPIPIDEENYMEPDWAWMSDALGVPIKTLTQGEMKARNEQQQDLNPQIDPATGQPLQPGQQPGPQQPGQPDASGQYGDTGQGLPTGVGEGAGGSEFGQGGAPSASGQGDNQDQLNMSQLIEIIGGELVLRS